MKTEENTNNVVNFEEVVEEIKQKPKTLANCRPVEFLKQTNRIRKSVEKWLEHTKILDIRKDLPKLKPITNEMSDEEKRAVLEENNQLTTKKVKENFMEILERAMDEYADETLEILALCCFVEPEKVNDYDIEFYLEALIELISSKAVINFFTLLGSLGATATTK